MKTLMDATDAKTNTRLRLIHVEGLMPCYQVIRSAHRKAPEIHVHEDYDKALLDYLGQVSRQVAEHGSDQLKSQLHPDSLPTYTQRTPANDLMEHDEFAASSRRVQFRYADEELRLTA